MMRAALVLLLGLAGCASPLHQLPESWPAVQPATGCPDLAGNFENVGATSGPFGAALSWFVMPSPDPEKRKHLEGAYRIEIAGRAEQELDVSAWRRTAFVERRTLKRNVDYRCENGALVLSLPPQHHSTQRGALLARATDNSLIARTTSLEAGMAYYILPYAVPMRVWARFEALPR
jgi:hypothetical protein